MKSSCPDELPGDWAQSSLRDELPRDWAQSSLRDELPRDRAQSGLRDERQLFIVMSDRIEVYSASDNSAILKGTRSGPLSSGVSNGRQILRGEML